MAIVAPDSAFLTVSAKDAKVYAPPWYRPGYPKSVRGAAWKRLRPRFKRFLERAHSRGEFRVYRAEPLWLAGKVSEAKGLPQIYQQAPAPLPEEGELVLNDPEPVAAIEDDLSLLERLGDRPLLFASIVAAATISVMSIFSKK